MTLPVGSIGMNQVNIELGKASGSSITLNDSNVRGIAEICSGTISMFNLRGKTAPPKAVNLPFIAGANATRSLTLSGINVGDMLFAATRVSGFPGVLQGYTSIAAQFQSAFNIGERYQFKIATSTSETITWSGQGGCLVAIPGMTQIGQQSSRFFQQAQTVSLLSTTRSNFNTTGTSFLIGGISQHADIASVSSPFLIAKSASCSGTNVNYGVFIKGNTKSSFTTSDTQITRASGNFGNGFTYLIEFLP